MNKGRCDENTCTEVTREKEEAVRYGYWEFWEAFDNDRERACFQLSVEAFEGYWEVLTCSAQNKDENQGEDV